MTCTFINAPFRHHSPTHELAIGISMKAKVLFNDSNISVDHSLRNIFSEETTLLFAYMQLLLSKVPWN